MPGMAEMDLRLFATSQHRKGNESNRGDQITEFFHPKHCYLIYSRLVTLSELPCA